MPWKYHHGTPFTAVTTVVASWNSEVMRRATAGTECAFSATTTESCAPSSSGFSEAATRTVRSPSAVRSVSPRSRMAARCGPRATSDTSAPA